MNYGCVLTEAGQAQIANALALGQLISLTQMAVGDGGGEVVTPDATMTALVGEKYKADVNRLTIDPNDPGHVIVELVIPSSQGGWTIREVGLFDVDGNLVAVGNTPESYKPTGAEGSLVEQTIRAHLRMTEASAGVLQLKIDPTIVLSTRQYVDEEVATRAPMDHGHPEKADVDHDHQDIRAAILPLIPKKITRILTSGPYAVAADTKLVEIWQWGAGGSGALEAGVNDAGGAGSGAFGLLRSKALAGEILSVYVGSAGAQGTTIPGHEGGDTYIVSPNLGELGRAGGGKGGAAPRGEGGGWTDGALVPVLAIDGSPGVSTSVELADKSGNFYHQGGPSVLLGGVLVSGGSNTTFGQGGSSSNVASFTSGKQGLVFIAEY
nr:phage tail protein [Pseudodesulfovibrio sp.]